jgi:2-oxoisovalerate dehydrogenase E2 component (dihydrolipoyl transacylase)
MSVKEFALPDLGEGLTESELVEWHIAVGDTVELNQVIAEVETAKALVQLPSPFAGVVTKLFEEPGATVRVGAPIVAFEVGGDAEADAPDTPVAADETGLAPATSAAAADGAGPTEPAEPEAARPEAAGAEPGSAEPAAAASEAAPESVAAPAERQSVLVGYGPLAETGDRPKRAARSAAFLALADAPAPASPLPAPPVRALARERGVDLAGVRGTGRGGAITREDVAAVAGAAASVPSREHRTAVRGVRKATAQAMVGSAFTAPHVTVFLTVDVTPTMELLAALAKDSEFRGQRLTILAMVAKAMTVATPRTPEVNSRWDEAAGEIVQYDYVNLGIAAATPRGLLVPNIKDADALTLGELGLALTELVDAARSGTTTPAALTGGTISISNVGVFGVDAGTPILNPGEAAILAIGAVRRMPWEFGDEIALRQVMTLSLSFDHRVVDGEQGSRFLADVGRVLAQPGRALTMI